eukprot:gene18634-541_t
MQPSADVVMEAGLIAFLVKEYGPEPPLPGTATSAAPASPQTTFATGDHVRIRDSEQRPWRDGRAAGSKGGSPVVNGRTWKCVEGRDGRPPARKSGGRVMPAPSGTEMLSEGGEVVLEKGAADRIGTAWASETELRLTSVHPGTAAERCGLRCYVGCRLTHVDGAAVQTTGDVRRCTATATKIRLTFAPAGLQRDGGAVPDI